MIELRGSSMPSPAPSHSLLKQEALLGWLHSRKRWKGKINLGMSMQMVTRDSC